MDISTSGPVIHLTGSFDARSTMQVRATIHDLLESYDQVVVDLDGTDVIDLTALNVLAYASRQATRDGRHLTLRGCGPAVRRMLRLSRLIRMVDVDRESVPA
jgi:anti-anti-sigma factor